MVNRYCIMYKYNSLVENKNVILIVNELHFEYFCKYFVSLINKPR